GRAPGGSSPQRSRQHPPAPKLPEGALRRRPGDRSAWSRLPGAGSPPRPAVRRSPQRCRGLDTSPTASSAPGALGDVYRGRVLAKVPKLPLRDPVLGEGDGGQRRLAEDEAVREVVRGAVVGVEGGQAEGVL